MIKWSYFSVKKNFSLSCQIYDNNGSNNQKIIKPILDISLLQDSNNNFTHSNNKNEGYNTNKKNGILFALKTNVQANNNSKII